MADVILTTRLPLNVEQAISAEFDCATVRLRELGTDGFLAAIGRPRAIVVAPGDPFDSALIARLPGSVALLASYSTGLDHVDVKAAEGRGLRVTGTPDVLTAATAEIAILLILMVVRGAVRAARLIERGEWTGWSPDQVFGRDIRGMALGVLGGGRIGAATAKRAAALGMEVRYWSRRRSLDMDTLGATHSAELEGVLEASDVVSLHVPSTSETRSMIDGPALARFKPQSYLINTARGDLIDDEAVLGALASGRLAGIGLDVFRGEPALHPGYLAQANAVLLPHIGSSTRETRDKMGQLVVNALRSIFTPEALS